MPAKVVPSKFAVMTVDPGKTTGMAEGVFRTDKGDDMLKSVLRRALKKNQIQAWEIKGLPHEQAWRICERWVAFRFKCNIEYGIAIPDTHLVIESFQLRTKQAHLEPVAITHSMLTLLSRGALKSRDMGEGFTSWPFGEPEYQEPSTGKHFSNARLKQYGLYNVGSEHKRDALRHLAQKVNDIL